ncbi:hypothetical protein PENSPDRAFT_628472 [Peniophora sp. CONT]|nr:hypothetical protein PENSPDRAFT_628472 [Peniophora sp. CONT]
MASGALVALSEEVHYRPGRTSGDHLDGLERTREPSLILIFGWMQANLPHLEKYSSEYARRYPRAMQLIVRCHPSFFVKSKTAQHAALSPAVQFLLREGFVGSKDAETSYTPQQPDRAILTHVFSNGGAYVLTVLSTLLTQYRAPQTSGPISSALVLDSTPGKANLSRTMTAFTAQMRSPLLRYPANVVLCLGYILLLAYHRISRSESLVDHFRRTLLSTQFLPWGSKHTPRLYIYSHDDALVGFDDVEEHIAEARRAGYEVETEFYTRSAHVAHMRTDPKRYWTAIESLWGSVAQPRLSE